MLNWVTLQQVDAGATPVKLMVPDGIYVVMYIGRMRATLSAIRPGKFGPRTLQPHTKPIPATQPGTFKPYTPGHNTTAELAQSLL